MQKFLFVCSQNRLRSPTAEQIFSRYPGLECDSAGLAPDAVAPLSSDQVEWADIIFVMERAHRNKLAKRFRSSLKNKRVVILEIPDEFELMEEALIQILQRKVAPFIR